MKKLMVLSIVVVVAFWWYQPADSKAPDERLVGHFDAICMIAERNIDTPHRGVQKIFHFLGGHAPDMLKQFGDLLVEIERIDNDREHDKRARLAQRRFRKHAKRCGPVMERFAEAVEADPEASALLERGVGRLGRTLEIIFGADASILFPLGT